jgi:hypothetical protein
MRKTSFAARVARVFALMLDRRPAVERVPELKLAWERVRRLERILTAAQADRAQQVVKETGRRRG